ncbi:helix-turn-helix domain-containing protein [Streptomyces sp. NPDC001914]|uniref:helix-turn-helix domain-containing protein n=1 Tax=Streptomyces sp. NPDC001914 TaxID=3364623 RepID=UPI00367FE92D
MTSSRALGAENSSADPPVSRQNSRRATDSSVQPGDESGNRAGKAALTDTDRSAPPESADKHGGAPRENADKDRGAPPGGADADQGAPPDRADTGDVLAASVARVRRAAGLTLSAVATRAGVSPAYVSQMESGAANPTVRTLAQIADALGATPAELLGGTAPVTAPAAAAPAFPPRFAPAPLLAQADGHRGIWDLTAPGAGRLGARLLHADLGDHDHPTAHPGEEFALVLAGSCRVSVGGVVRLLRHADSCHFAATDEHHFTDASDDLLMLVVLTEE